MPALSEVALFTDRVDEMAAFYETLLGAAPTYRGDGIAIFKVEGVTLLIHTKSASQPGGPPNQNHIALAVPDLDAACDSLAAQGMTIMLPPKTYDWGRSAYLRDPDGQMVELQAKP